MSLERPFDRLLNARPLLSFATLSSYFVHVSGRATGGIGLFQPFSQQRFQFTHVLEAQLDRLESTNSSLREHIPVQSSESQPDISLREPQFNSPLFELLGKAL